MSSPSVTVITACHKSLDDLKLHASSVLENLGTSDEWFIQDSASGDGTVNYLKSLCDSRITIISEPDTGVYDAFNRAVLCARGDYFLFLGSDDSLIIHMDDVRPLLVDSRTIYYGDARLTSSGQIYGGVFSAKRLARTNICHQSIFYPRTAFAERTFNKTYGIQADWEFNMVCMANSALRFEYMDICVAAFNNISGLSSRYVDIEFQRDYTRMLRRYFRWRDSWMPWSIHTASSFLRRLLRKPLLRERPAMSGFKSGMERT